MSGVFTDINAALDAATKDAAERANRLQAFYTKLAGNMPSTVSAVEAPSAHAANVVVPPRSPAPAGLLGEISVKAATLSAQYVNMDSMISALEALI
jgi:hypothetical protein